MSYLLGGLSDEEMERFDELSVTDEPFAQRLREVEFDLVDGYVRGELPGALRARIEAVYAASERGRSRLQFADALHTLTRHRARPIPAVAPRGARARPSWALPVAATVIVAVAGALLLASNLRLRRDARQLASQRDSLVAAAEQLRSELAARSPIARSAAQPATAMFLLRAPRRGADIPSIDVPTRVDQIGLNLQLESNDFTAYYAAVMRTAAPPVVWRSGDLQANAGTDGPVVRVTIPASILTPGRYRVDLTGRSRRGADEPLASYPFDVVVK